MAPRTYLGRDDRGLLGFDFGDGGPPAWLPPTPDTTAAALRMTADAGGDPASVLLGAPLPPRRGAMSPDALAAGDASTPDGRKPSLMWDAPAAPANPFLIEVDPSKALPARPAAPQLPAGPIEIQSGPGDVSAAKAAGMSQPQIDRMRSAAYRAEETKPAPPAAPAGPALSAGTPGAGLVATPTAAGGGGGGGGGPADPYANLNPEERKKLELDRVRLQLEAGKRPSAGQLLKGGKIQTAESWQGEAGPNAETLAAMKANADAAAKTQGLQAQANAERDAKIGDVQQQQADYEQEHARIQAEIAQRKQDALAGLGQQSRTLQQKIASAEIDPTRWYANRSTGDKIMMGVAVALDGVVKGLTGRGVGQPSPILGEMVRLQGQDIDAQIKNIDKQRGDLNDLQRVYVQTKEQFGDEALAADATKLAGLAAFRAQIQQAALQADNARGTEPTRNPADVALAGEMEAAFREALGGDTPMAQQAAELRLKKLAGQTRSYSLKARALELDVERQALAKQAELEARMNGALSKQFGFTQDRYVGGSAGANLDKMSEIQGKNAAMLRGADNDAAKGGAGKDAKMIFVDGQPIATHTGASQGSVDKAQDLIGFADQGLDMVGNVEKRAAQGGGMVPGDPRIKIASAGIASVLSNAQGGGAPNDNVMKTIADAVTAGPRQGEAIAELKSEFNSAKRRGIQRVGAAKLWPTFSRCTTPRRGRRCRWPRTTRGPCSGRARRPSPPTRTCLCSGPMGGCRCSRAPRPGPTSRAPPGSRAGPRAGPRCESSSCKTSSAGSAGRRRRWPQAWRAGPPWASATPS